MKKWIKSRGISGEQGWLNLDNNQFTTTNPYTHQKTVTQQSTSVVMPQIIQPRKVKVKVKKKEYQPTLLGFASAIKDKLTGKDKVIDNGAQLTEDKRTPFQRNLAYQLQHNNTPLGYVAQTVVPAATAAATLTGIGTTAQAIAGGAASIVPFGISAIKNGVATVLPSAALGSLTNTVSKKVSGKSFDQLANEYTNSSLGDLYNPGYALGSAAGKVALDHYVLPRFRASMYKNVTPFGYDNQLPSDNVPRKEQIKNMLKDALSTKKIDTNKEPKWKIAVAQSNYGERAAPVLADFRDEAYRKALRLPSKYPLYLDNGDGTVRYNSAYVKSRYNAVGYDTPEHLPVTRYTNGDSFLSGDHIGHNGGYVNMVNNHDGTYTMNDVWDLHPFSDNRALFGIRFPGSKYIEGLSLLGGDAFTLKHTFKAPGEIRK